MTGTFFINSNIFKKCLSLIIYLLLVILAGCQPVKQPELRKYSERKYLMGTHVQMDVCIDEKADQQNIEEAFKKAWERVEDIAWRMSIFDDRSDLAAINTSPVSEPAEIGADTYYVIEKAAEHNRLSDGAFDITVLPLLKFWKEMARTGQVPSEDQVHQIKTAVGMNNLKLLGDNKIARLNDQTNIDLGGIAKGYAVDEAARILREFEINNLFIDAGGDIYAGGVNCQRESWRVGIRHPLDIEKIIDVIAVKDMAVTTSGNYFQYFQLNKNKLSHIINPITGYPQQHVVSATVIAPTAMDADALSTSMCVLGESKGTDVINKLGKSYASLIITYDELKGDIKILSDNYHRFQADK